MALNRGVPVVIDNPNSKVSTAIKKLAQMLIKNTEIYVEHQELEQLRSQAKDTLPKPGTFWDAVGLTELQKHMEIITEDDEVVRLKRRIHQRLIEELDLKRLDLEIITNAQKAKELREKAEKIVSNLLAEETGAFLSSFEVRQRLVNEVCDEALGLGPLEDLLKDNEITDILVNNKDQVYVERNGRLEMTTKKFISNDQVRIIIERIIAPLGRRLDETALV
jgi:pilus assembly protein CpaF